MMNDLEAFSDIRLMQGFNALLQNWLNIYYYQGITKNPYHKFRLWIEKLRTEKEIRKYRAEVSRRGLMGSA